MFSMLQEYYIPTLLMFDFCLIIPHKVCHLGARIILVFLFIAQPYQQFHQRSM